MASAAQSSSMATRACATCPASAAGAAAGNSTRREAVTNFEVDKTVRHTKVASGQVRRLTAAVVVNHRGGRDGAAPAPDGRR